MKPLDRVPLVAELSVSTVEGALTAVDGIWTLALLVVTELEISAVGLFTTVDVDEIIELLAVRLSELTVDSVEGVVNLVPLDTVVLKLLEEVLVALVVAEV